MMRRNDTLRQPEEVCMRPECDLFLGSRPRADRCRKYDDGGEKRMFAGQHARGR